MLVTADKFYGVLFNNQKVSSIRSIKREEAMEFVDQVCPLFSTCRIVTRIFLGGPSSIIIHITLRRPNVKQSVLLPYAI